VVDALVPVVNVGPEGKTDQAPVVPACVLPVKFTEVAEHKFCGAPALTKVGLALTVKVAFAVVLHEAEEDSVTDTFPVIGAVPILTIIAAVPDPDAIVVPVGEVQAYVLPVVDVVLNVAPVVPSHKVVVPVMLGAGLIGLFTVELAATAAHGAFVTDHVNV
jgi:hypothetical protein